MLGGPIDAANIGSPIEAWGHVPASKKGAGRYPETTKIALAGNERFTREGRSMDADNKHDVADTEEIRKDSDPAFTEPAQGQEETPMAAGQDGDAKNEGAGDFEEAPDEDTSDRAQEIAAKAAGAAFGAAKGAASTLKAGAFALRDVRNASRQSADARVQAKKIEEALESDQEVLDHRREIESSYASIVEGQSRVVADAKAQAASARQRFEGLGEEHAALLADLDELKAANASELRPYKRIAETAKGALDDANRSLSEAKRAVKTAEGQVRDAADRREQSVSSANRALDNAQARQLRVQDDLKKLQAQPGSPSAIAKMQSENVAALARVEAARAEVDRATREGQVSVENAQTHLWTQNQSLEAAQREASAAKSKYDEQKADLDRRMKDAEGKEAELQYRIDQKKKAIEKLEDDIKVANQAQAEAQGLIDEAELIHSTPEETVRLEHAIAAQRIELQQALAEVELYETTEKALRKQTRLQRFALIGAVALIVAIIAAVAVLCLR